MILLEAYLYIFKTWKCGNIEERENFKRIKKEGYRNQLKVQTTRKKKNRKK
jgi:hypothetical protein